MDNRNLILAIVLSVAILFGFELLFPKTPVPVQQATAPSAQGTQDTSNQPTVAPTTAPSTTAPPAAGPGLTPTMPTTAEVTAAMASATAEKSVAQLLQSPNRITISSHHLQGSLSLLGARLDDLVLTTFNETLDEGSAKIRLLSPRGSAEAYYAEHGWIAAEGVKLPGTDSLWTSNRSVLSPESPVTLSWNNGEGLTFNRTIALDDDYMFTITQGITNASNAPVTVNPYGLVSRWSMPEGSGLYILHEGPLGVFDGTLMEADYSDLVDDGTINTPSNGGWLGFTDKYWLTALIPDQTAAINTRMLYSNTDQIQKFQTDYVGGEMSVAAGTSAQTTSHFFAGAKKVALLDKYAEDLNVVNFDLAIDFGWLYFLTKPIFYAMNYIYGIVGNFGVAILLLTVGIKAILYPLANKSYVSMSRMKKLQPEVKKLQAKYKEDKTKLNQEMMALYKREKANPAAGCLPMLVQIPIFFALYKVLLVTIEMRHAPFFGWIKDLSVPDPASVWTLFGLIPWDHLAYIPGPLDIGIWPIIMGFTMWLQQRLNPQPTDPIQAKMFFYLPFVFTFLLASFAAGLVIYWAWNNTLSILQQWLIMRRMGVKVGNQD